jgi:hypothetical protein
LNLRRILRLEEQDEPGLFFKSLCLIIINIIVHHHQAPLLITTLRPFIYIDTGTSGKEAKNKPASVKVFACLLAASP